MINNFVEDATKALALARSLDRYNPPFIITGNYKLIDNGVTPEATVHVMAEGISIHEASNGNGPVDALANVLRKALVPLFPEIAKIKLVDYHAKILGAQRGTRTEVEVTIIFTDGEEFWRVYSMSENINHASFIALVDGFEFAILKHRNKGV